MIHQKDTPLATESTEEHGNISLKGFYLFVFFVDSVAINIVFSSFLPCHSVCFRGKIFK